jgi:hypothetical protein
VDSEFSPRTGISSVYSPSNADERSSSLIDRQKLVKDYLVKAIRAKHLTFGRTRFERLLLHVHFQCIHYFEIALFHDNYIVFPAECIIHTWLQER